MAEHGGAAMADDPRLKEFLDSRQRAYGRFVILVTWTVASIALILILLAIFLL